MNIRKLNFKEWKMGRTDSFQKFDIICIDCVVVGDKTNRNHFARIFLTKNRKVERIHYYGLISNHEEYKFDYKKPIEIKTAKKVVKQQFQYKLLLYLRKSLNLTAEDIIEQFNLKLIRKSDIEFY